LVCLPLTFTDTTNVEETTIRKLKPYKAKGFGDSQVKYLCDNKNPSLLIISFGIFLKQDVCLKTAILIITD